MGVALFSELCTTGRVHELARLHRFAEAWEAAASLQLRAGSPRALDAYEAHGRIIAGPFLDHLEVIAKDWLGLTLDGRTVAVTAATNDHVDPVNDAIQRMRLTIGQLQLDGAVWIAGGEVAYPGDIVATRRNDRQLLTAAGQPIRNRDLWDVVATHPNGSITVSHRSGHGAVVLPADYAQDQVRLGYAATEHGNQADTVDVAIELVSTATTHRGLYVGATRGRDENRIHVITATDDLTEARDVLGTVLAHDRADIPAVTQRRDLASQAQPRRPEPASILPDWVGPWRAQLEQRREDLVDQIGERARRRAEATADLADLQPELAVARSAWRPYGTAIAKIEDEMRRELRPAMWKANRDAVHAGFGHRHATARRAKAANERVADAEACIAAIRADASDVKQHLDRIQAEGANLADLAHPSPAAAWLDQLNRDQLINIDGILDALEVWTMWADGGPVSVTEFDHAVGILVPAAREAPPFARSPSELDFAQWHELLASVTRLLSDQSVEPRPDPRAVGPDGHGPSIEF